MSKPNDLVQGTLDLLLLKILALEPLHGWAISLRLKSISGDVLQVSEGSLYPALHKLEQEGWITAEWKQTENNRRAKFYSLTRLGKKQLESEAANWQRLSSAISQVSLSKLVGELQERIMRMEHWWFTVPLTAEVASCAAARRNTNSTKSSSSTWNAKSRKASPMAFPQKRRATRRCAHWTAWSNAKRRCETCDAFTG